MRGSPLSMRNPEMKLLYNGENAGCKYATLRFQWFCCYPAVHHRVSLSLFVPLGNEGIGPLSF